MKKEALAKLLACATETERGWADIAAHLAGLGDKAERDFVVLGFHADTIARTAKRVREILEERKEAGL